MELTDPSTSPASGISIVDFLGLGDIRSSMEGQARGKRYVRRSRTWMMTMAGGDAH
jgi:hypothetical protein